MREQQARQQARQPPQRRRRSEGCSSSNEMQRWALRPICRRGRGGPRGPHRVRRLPLGADGQLRAAQGVSAVGGEERGGEGRVLREEA